MGKKYIEPILDKVVGNIGEAIDTMKESIAAMKEATDQQVEKLTETTDLLQAISKSTGIPLTQKGYSGSAFSSLSINNINWPKCISGVNPTSTTEVEIPHKDAADHSTNIVDLAEVVSIEGEAYLITNWSGGEPPKTALIKIDTETVFTDQLQVYSPYSERVDFAIDVTEYVGECEIDFSCPDRNEAQSIGFENIYCVYADGTKIEIFEYMNNLKFSSNKLVCDTAPAFGTVTFTSIGSPVLWNSLIVIGQLEGVEMWLVDNNNDIVKELGAVTDISDITDFGNQRIMFKFHDNEAEIGSVIFRFS